MITNNEIMNSVSERLEYARKQRGKSYRELAEVVKLTPDAVRKAIHRDSIKDNHVNTFSDFLRINKEWLITGEGEMDYPLTNDQAIVNEKYELEEVFKNIPKKTIAIYVAENEDDFMKFNLFKNIIEKIAYKRAIEIIKQYDSNKK